MIVDGSSQDKAIEIIGKWIEIDQRIRLIIEPGSNTSQGRNIAIRIATYDSIVCTDTG